ncbi:MAG: hypothetical protein AAGA56_18745 [Myxococcota bacterium]
MVAAARTGRAHGYSLAKVSDTFGVSNFALSKWLRRPVALRSVRIRKNREDSPLISTAVIVSPGGFEVRGLDLEQMATVL